MILKLINLFVIPSPLVIIFFDEILGLTLFRSNAHWIMVGWSVLIVANVLYLLYTYFIKK